MADIFLSYKKEDRAVAERLVHALRATGRSVWWDDALNPAQAWDAMIEREIAAAKVVIVLWTSRSVQSDWVRSEAHYAQDHHKLIPVMLEKCSIPIAFMLRQAVDLSAGEFAEANPQWGKLLNWIDAVETHDVEALPDHGEMAATADAVPVKALAKERWLGPSRKPMMAIGLVALLVAAAIGLFLARGSLGFGTPVRPDVYVDAFTVVHDKDLRPGFEQTFADEMTAQLSSSSRISPLESDGKRHPQAYQMSGNIRTGEGKFILFAKIFAPGIAAPIISPRLEVPIEEKATAAKQLATDAAIILRCTATASDSSGSEITVLPEAAIRPWAQYCNSTIGGNYDPAAARGYLQATLAAAPNFANGWSNLADEQLGMLTETGADLDSVRAGIRTAYGKALDLDPDNQKALIIKATDVLGVMGRGPTLLTPLGNFEEFDRLAMLANNVRPSDCGCEAIIYGQVLQAFGRAEASLPYFRKVVANDPSNLYSLARVAMNLSALGRDDEAHQLLQQAQESWPTSRRVHYAATIIAIAHKDWARARTELPLTGPFPGKDKVAALVEALQSGNKAAIDAAVQPLAAMIGRQTTYSAPGAVALVAAGRQADVAAALLARGKQLGVFALNDAWLPGMATMRTEPAFIALVKQLNLAGYWRLPDHRPDACSGGASEPVCNLI